MMDQQKIFFSYARKDASDFALKLAGDLKKAGADVWIDQVDILPSQRWDTEIQKALEGAGHVLFLATDNSVTSDNVLDEIHYALNNNKQVIPILVTPCRLPYRTSRLQAIDFTEKYEERLSVLLKALRIETRPGEAFSAEDANTEGVEFYKKQLYEEAIHQFTQAVALDPEYSDAFYNRGLAHEKLGKQRKAIADYTKAIQLSADTEPYLRRGTLYSELRNYKKAVADFTNYIEQKPSDATGHYSRGLAYVLTGNYQRALDDYTKAIELNAKHADAYKDRGVCHHYLGNYKKAIADYNKALKIDPALTAAHYDKGWTYLEMEDYQNSIASSTKAIALDPNDADAYLNRGVALYSLGNFNEAIADYGQALALAPDRANIYLNRGLAKSALSDASGACKDFKKACQLGDEDGCAEYDKLCKNKGT